MLTSAGATVVGPKPSRAPGLCNYPQCDKAVKDLADAVWGPCDGKTVTEHAFGKGRVVWGRPLREILSSNGIAPDFEFTSSREGAFLDYIHRSCGDAEIYFVANRKNQWEETACTFRVAGKAPELWDAVTGERRDAVAFKQQGGRTLLPLELAPNSSLFVVFRNPISAAAAGKATGNFPKLNPLKEITGSWAVRFDPKWGAPESVEFVKLEDWSKRPEEGIKHYSGAATYTRTFDLQETVPGTRVFLDLGKVKNVAEVTLNGKALGVIWTAPWHVEISDVVKASGNHLEIRVANLWPNRLIGDQSLPAAKRLTNTNVAKFKKDSPLPESGLLGPVTLQIAEKDTPQRP